MRLDQLDLHANDPDGAPGSYALAGPVLVRQHEPRTPPGLLAGWLRERGIPFEVSHSWKGEKVGDPGRYSFVASLGAPYGPNDTHEPLVVAELGLIGAAVEKGVPVLGLCFGGRRSRSCSGGRSKRPRSRSLGGAR